MMKKIIETDQAPSAVGTYSQAVQVGNTVYISGQVPLDPVSMEMVEGDFKIHARQMFTNLIAVVNATGANADHVIKLSLFLTDMNNFSAVNEVMQEFFNKPYPARSAVEVRALPRNAVVEVEAIVVLES